MLRRSFRSTGYRTPNILTLPNTTDILIAFVVTKKVMQFVNNFYVACLHIYVNMSDSGTAVTAH
jgi:hypothetical protein